MEHQALLSSKDKSKKKKKLKWRLLQFLFGALRVKYRISLVIRQSFSFQNNPKNLDPSYKTGLDLWDCLGRVKLVL